jgi:hypothetical protein
MSKSSKKYIDPAKFLKKPEEYAPNGTIKLKKVKLN